MSAPCNMDCFNCPYEDCIFDGITQADIAESNERTRLHRAEVDKQYAYQREYREANRDAIAAYQREYYEANRDAIAAKQREYREANRDAIAAYQREIRTARKLRGYTQRVLGALIGVDRSTISHWESGKAPADWELLYTALPELAERSRPFPA